MKSVDVIRERLQIHYVKPPVCGDGDVEILWKHCRHCWNSI